MIKVNNESKFEGLLVHRRVLSEFNKYLETHASNLASDHVLDISGTTNMRGIINRGISNCNTQLGELI
jgi:hypothetical protein